MSIRPSVVDGFIGITRDHEGVVPWPYLDRLGLVTTAMGNLVEDRATATPTALYFEQPWQNASGALATRGELQSAFDAVKDRQDLAPLGGGNVAFANLTRVRLGPPGTPANVVTPEIYAFVMHVLSSFADQMKTHVHAFEALNADAQLALLEHAWAAGPDLSGWPHLCAALNASPPDYRTAEIEDAIGGITAARAQMQADLWTNAAEAQDAGANPDQLFYPGTVASPGFLSATRLSAAASRAGPRAAAFFGALAMTAGAGYLGWRLSSGLTRNPFRPGLLRRLA